MRYSLMLLKFIGKGLANMVGAGIAGDVLFEVVPEVASDVYKWWNKERDGEEQKQDLEALAQASPSEIKEEVAAIVDEVAADKSPEFKKDLAVYLSLVPGQVRKSLRSPEDPSGRTASRSQIPQKAEDIVPLLPTNLPRFKPGQHPLPAVDLELVEMLGVGGMGEVWKARNPHLDNMPPVALKFCLDPSAAQYLRNEAAVLNRVMKQGRHPNIVTLEATYLSSEPPCLQYEYVEGGDLAGLIKQWHSAKPKPTAVEISRVFCKLAEVMSHAHSQDPPIVHRDLKPANVLRQMFPDGTSMLKVADFGIGGVAARKALGEKAMTQGSGGMFLATALRGSCTPLYASVQQMRGDAPDPRDDVYALGVIWYQMVTGNLQASRPGGTRWQTRLSDEGLSPKVAALMAECFEDNLDDRISDAGELARRLYELLPEGPLPGVRMSIEGATIPGAGSKPPVPVTPIRSVRPLDPALRRPDVADKEDARMDDLKHRLMKIGVVIDTDPEDARAWAERGEIYRQLGKNDEAINDCTQAILLDSNMAMAYATRGGAYRMKRDYDSAISDCTKASELDPTSVLAWYQRGESNRLKARLDRAISDFTQAINLDPKYYWAIGARGAAYQQKGDHAKALADLDETISLEPTYAWAWAVRAETYRLRGEYDLAITNCNEALKLRGKFTMAMATRGAAFRQKGDFATAIRDLDEVIRMEPANQFARDQHRLAQQRRK